MARGNSESQGERQALGARFQADVTFRLNQLLERTKLDEKWKIVEYGCKRGLSVDGEIIKPDIGIQKHDTDRPAILVGCKTSLGDRWKLDGLDVRVAKEKWPEIFWVEFTGYSPPRIQCDCLKQHRWDLLADISEGKTAWADALSKIQQRLESLR